MGHSSNKLGSFFWVTCCSTADNDRLGPLLLVAEKVLLYAVDWDRIALLVETDWPRAALLAVSAADAVSVAAVADVDASVASGSASPGSSAPADDPATSAAMTNCSRAATRSEPAADLASVGTSAAAMRLLIPAATAGAVSRSR